MLPAIVPPAGRQSLARHRVAVPATTAIGQRCQTVNSDRLAALRDLLEERIRDDRPAAGYHAAIAELTAPLLGVLMPGGNDVDRSMASFFDACCGLVVEPGGAPARARVVLAAETVAAQLRRVDQGLEHVFQRADHEVRRAVSDVNVLARWIGGLNIELRGTPAASTRADELRDQLRRLLSTLSQLVNINLVRQCGGAVDVSVGPRRPLVLGGSAVPLLESSMPGAPCIMLSSGGVVVSGDITSGRLGGLLHARNSLLPGYRLRLDTLAHSFVTGVNALHVTGFDAAGAAGGMLFVPIGAMAGAAAAVSVPAAMRANPMRVAAGSSATARNRDVALGIAALRHRAAVNGSWTFAEAWAHIVAAVSRESERSRAEQLSRDQLVRQMQSLRDNLPCAERRDAAPDDARSAGTRVVEVPAGPHFPA